MSFATNTALFHPRIREMMRGNPLVVVDVGASGKLVEPWASIKEIAPEMLVLVGFEPDAEACSKLNERSLSSTLAGEHYFPSAVWCDESELTFQLADNPSTSSIHPPNWALLDEFASGHGTPRRTDRTLRMSGRQLDTVLAEQSLDVDFIKIDTQGSEYEILQGGETIARSRCFGLTLETWTTEVHAEQYLTHDVMRLVLDFGFRIFDIARTAVWQRRANRPFRSNRGELVGVDLLCFKPGAAVRDWAGAKLLKAALIADLWGYRAYAAQLLELASRTDEDTRRKASEILDVVQRLDRKIIVRPQSRLGQLLDLILPRMFKVRPQHPAIH